MTTTTILTTTLIILQIYLAYIYRNYRTATRTRLPRLISPITPYTPQWKLASVLFRPLLLRFKWFRAIDWTCCWHDGDELHRELGSPAFILVSPGCNVLCTRDARTIEHVLKKWREFVKPDNVNEILGTFGQNVDTSNGDDWIRHRKLTAPCFSERASATVWSEALQQSDGLIDQWLSSPNSTTNSMVRDTGTLALNVISSVAFENNQVNEPTPGHTLSLRDTLATVLSTSISPAMEGILPWLNWRGLGILLPTNIRKLLVAMNEFRQYTDETVARERAKKSAGEIKVPTLISTLIKANEGKSEKDGVTKIRLSDVELRGNIFIFIAAGLETTAITLSYSLALLAIHPDVQEWVQEELDGVMNSIGEDAMQYTSVFPKLKRVMAVMVSLMMTFDNVRSRDKVALMRDIQYETLRLYGPSPPLPRSPFPAITSSVPVGSRPEIPITDHRKDPLSSSSIILPPNTQLMLNSWAAQTSPTHFPNPLIWDPRRWIQPSTDVSGDTNDTLLHPASGSGFYAWGSGPRICPGMKFSQVEFSAVLTSILRKIRVELVTGDAKENALSVLRDSYADPLLLHMRRPEELELKIVQR